MLRKEVLQILACPHCQGRLADREIALKCRKCFQEYPVKECIPTFFKSK